MNRVDDPGYFYGSAWAWILQAAESVLEDDTNEDDLPEDEYNEILAACFDIFRDAETYARYL